MSNKASGAGVKVKRPANDDEWDDFLSRYASGEYFHCNFADDARSDPPQSDSPPSDESGPVSTPVAGPAPSRPGPTPTHPSTTASTVTLTEQSVTTVTPSRLPPNQSALFAQVDSDDRFGNATPPITDDHPDTSASGPSNQDPAIPNIDDVDKQDRGALHGHGSPEVWTGSKAKKLESPPAMGHMPPPLEDSRRRDAPVVPNMSSVAVAGQTPVRPGMMRRQSSQKRPIVIPEVPVIAPRESATPASMGLPGPPHSPVSSSGDNVLPDMDGGAHTESSASVAASAGNVDSVAIDPAEQRERIRKFFHEHGYMPAPSQPPEATRRRLKAIRRLGLDSDQLGEDGIHRATLDRFTRLACSVFNTKVSVVTIVGNDRQLFPSERGLNLRTLELDVGLCCHTVMSTDGQCLVVDNVAEDWRFKANPFVAKGSGPIQFYAGAPLVLGHGKKQATIGTLCVIDDKPRYDFGDYGRAVLTDLAACVVSELELLYQEQASKWIAKMHQTSVDFQRRSLQVRAPIKPISRRHQSHSSTGSTASSGQRDKADRATESDGSDVNMYDEACREIRTTLDAYAVAVVDLSQFHMFYPAYAGSSTGTSGQASSTTGRQSSNWHYSGQGSGSTASLGGWSMDSELSMPYARPEDRSRARPTYSVDDPTAARPRMPQVVFVPKRRRSDPKAPRSPAHKKDDRDDVGLDVLGYSCAHDGFVFSFLSSPAAREIISEFIALNVRNRKVWYARDDSENVAASITKLMPPGTETSLAMPIYDFDGQVAFAIVACWTDPLFSYPSGALAFVESIAGTLLASVMKEKLHQIERSQMMFATAASHETRTPLHQLLASAAALRATFGTAIMLPDNSPSGEDHSAVTAEATLAADIPRAAETRQEIAHQLDVIEANGAALSNILENIVDTLDVGRLAPKKGRSSAAMASGEDEVLTEMVSLSAMLEEVTNEVMATNAKLRRVAGGDPDNVEAILEVIPRERGGWLMGRDDGPLRRALTKIIDNAFKFTDSGFVHITVQDVSRHATIAGGMDNSMSMSTIAFNIRDSGRGMTSEFLETNLLQPFAKADPFSSGSGLGLGLAQRLIELLGGKLAVQSTVGLGTTVQIEVPLRLMNRDHESDLENVEFNSDGEWGGDLPTEVRPDNIYLAGFAESSKGSLRRVGKSLTRQLKQLDAHLTQQISDARLIVATAEIERSGQLTEYIQAGRPDVEVVILCETADTSRPYVPPRVAPVTGGRSVSVSDYVTTPVRRLPRFLSPSVIREIVWPISTSPVPSPSAGPVSPTRSRLALVDARVGCSSETSVATVQPIQQPVPKSPERPVLLHVDASDPLPFIRDTRPSLSRAMSELPVTREQSPENALLSPEQALRVLVVEDNAINRKILTGMLRKMGVHFGEAVDGVEAVDKFLAFRPGVVLLDINMPRKDGFDTATEMRTMERVHRRTRCTIVAVTAMSSELLKRRGLFECGIDAWRTKPVSIKDLKRDVETLLAGGKIS